jgi:hypothetical protein
MVDQMSGRRRSRRRQRSRAAGQKWGMACMIDQYVTVCLAPSMVDQYVWQAQIATASAQAASGGAMGYAHHLVWQAQILTRMSGRRKSRRRRLRPRAGGRWGTRATWPSALAATLTSSRHTPDPTLRALTAFESVERVWFTELKGGFRGGLRVLTLLTLTTLSIHSFLDPTPNT